MDHTVAEGDKLIIWWPNGHGYDEVEVQIDTEGDPMFVHAGSYEVEHDGTYKRVESHDF